MQKAQSKLMSLGKSKLLELLVEEDVTLVELAEGGDINGHDLDDFTRMTRNELRVFLREKDEDIAAKDKVIAEKNKKVDELVEKLAKKQTREPNPKDVAGELTMRLSTMTIGIRSDLSRLRDLFEQLKAHGEAHGFDHSAQMVGSINQVIRDAEMLREMFYLPKEAPTDDVPEWLEGHLKEQDGQEDGGE